jgi:hypothetical protein
VRDGAGKDKGLKDHLDRLGRMNPPSSRADGRERREKEKRDRASNRSPVYPRSARIRRWHAE